MNWRQILTAFAICLSVIVCSSIAGALEEDNPEYEALGDLESQYGLFVSPYQDVPTGDWAYNAINNLMAKGLLDGTRGNKLPGDLVLTRIEMAEIVASLVSNFVALKTGDNPFAGQSVRIAQANQPGYPALGSVSSGGGIVPSGGPRPLAPELTPGPIQVPQPQTQPPAAVEQPAPEAKKTLEEKINLTMKDVQDLQDLVSKFKKELKDLGTTMKKELAAGKKISLQNQRDIAKLKENSDRFKITGEEKFTYLNEAQFDYETNVTMKNELKLRFDSIPVPAENVSVGGSLVAQTDMGGRLGQAGVLDGSNTALSLGDLFIDYTNTAMKNKFGLSNLRVGDIVVSWSPLTAFGAPWRGAQATLKVGQWALTLMGARTNLHTSYFDAAGHEFKYISTIEGKSGEDVLKGLPYDRYTYGFSVAGTLFREPASMFILSRMVTFDDKDSVSICEYLDSKTGRCENYLDVGEWIFNSPMNLGVIANPAFPKKEGLFHTPPEKNSISSLFLRYPVYDNTFLTLEYAHSTYFREAYRAEKPYIGKTPYDPYKYEPGRDNDPGSYRYIPERNIQDEALLLLFDYKKGPWWVFPVGYVRLGPGFTSTTFLSGITGLLGATGGGGGGGLDIGSFTSIGLPVQVQSLELYVGHVTYTADNGKYKLETLYLSGGELKPLFIDPALTVVQVPDLAQLSALDWLNNRKGLITLTAMMNSGEYYINQNVSVSANFAQASVDLSDPCIDSTVIEIDDIDGVGLIQQYGDGIANCEWMPNYNPAITSDITRIELHLKIINQNFGLKWKTSKRTQYNFSYNILDLKNNTTEPAQLTGDPRSPSQLVDDLVSRKQYTMTHDIQYQLGKTTDIKLSYSHIYDRLPDGADIPGNISVCDSDKTFCSTVDDKYTIKALITTTF